jgi:hypothetical protein
MRIKIEKELWSECFLKIDSRLLSVTGRKSYGRSKRERRE